MTDHSLLRNLILFGVLLLLLPQQAAADEIFETFLEPNRVVDLMSSQRERLVELRVADGDTVAKDQLLAVFDTRVLQARLDLLKTATTFKGSIDSAKALVALRESKLQALENLSRSGNARPLELDIARTNVAIAEAQFQEAVEEQRFKQMEQQVVLAQIEQKKLFSPIDGVVARVDKLEGDLVGGPGSEPIMTLVQLDPLVAEFHLPPEAAARLGEGQRATLEQAGVPVEAEIVFVAPVIEAQSGTILVRMQIPNPDGALLSGSRIKFKSYSMENN